MEVIDISGHFFFFHALRFFHRRFLASDVAFVFHGDFHFLHRVGRKGRAAQGVHHFPVGHLRAL